MKENGEEVMRVRKVAEHCSYLFLASAGVPHGEGSEVSCVRQGGTCSARLHGRARAHTHTHTQENTHTSMHIHTQKKKKCTYTHMQVFYGIHTPVYAHTHTSHAAAQMDQVEDEQPDSTRG